MSYPLFVHSDIDDMTDLTPNALRVYMHLSRRADREGRAWPSYQAIGDHCFAAVSDNAATRKTFARKAIDELVAANLITREERARDDGGQTSNSYMLISPSMPISPPVSIDTPMLNEQPPCLIDTPHAYQAPEDNPIEDTPTKKLEEEDAPVRDAVHVAWSEIFGGALPEHLELAVSALVAECGEAATIHGFQAGKDADSHNFSFIAKCARNYIPAATNTNGYHVDIPGVHVLLPLQQPTPAAALSPPMTHDDPWAVALAEILPTLTPHAAGWLKGSTLRANGELAGVPFYRVTVQTEAGNVGWLNQKVGTLIRKTLSSILHKRLEVEIVAEEMEITA